MPGTQHLVEDFFISINGTNISDFVKTPTIVREREHQNRTSVSRLHEAQDIGAQVRSISLECFQDYGAGGINELIAPLSRSGADVTVVYRRKSTAAAADNPQQTLTMWVGPYTPEKGAFGEQAMCDILLEARGDETRVTA